MTRRFHAKTAKAAKLGCSLRALRPLRELVVLFFVLAVAARASAQQTHLLVITGVPGDDEHAQKFQKWAAAFIDAAKKKDAVPAANITSLAERQATRESVDKACADIAARAKPDDAVVVLLIGHGSFDGRVGAFNLPGPDLTGPDWAKLLDRFPSQHVAFVNTSSASGAFLVAVAKPGRVVVTATKTGGEKNETLFPEYFVAAFTDEAADRDHNGHVSVLEAFEHAKSKVTQAYQQKGLILTEHAAMDDGSEGRLAATIFLGIGRSDTALTVDMNDPAVRALVEQRDALDRQIAALKLKKPEMDPAQYDAEMETLLTDLALKTKALRDRQTKKDDSR